MYLIDAGLLDLPILYLSRYFLDNRPLYYQGLRQVTEEEKWIEWVTFVLDGIIYTAAATRERMQVILELMSETLEKVKKLLPRASEAVTDILFERPYCKIRFFEEAGIARRDTVSAYLRKLEEAGILRSVQKGREKYFINEALLNLLTRDDDE